MDTIRTKPHEYTLVRTLGDAKKLADTLSRQHTFSFDTETTGLDVRACDIVGIGFSWERHSGVYVSIPRERETAKRFLGAFQKVLAGGTVKVGHNLKYDLGVLHQYGIAVEQPICDTLLMAKVLDENLRSYALDSLSEQFLNYKPIALSALLGKKVGGAYPKTLGDLFAEEVYEYGAEDCDVCLQLYQFFLGKMRGKTLWPVLAMENALVPVVTRMEYAGVRLDTARLSILSEKVDGDMQGHEKKFLSYTGENEKINLNSPQQVSRFLYTDLNIPTGTVERGKNGYYSVAKEALGGLSEHHPTIGALLGYRKAAKLKTAYTDRLWGFIHPQTGKVHTQFFQYGCVTGRFSSKEPALQTIPKHSALGNFLRSVFIASDGNVLIAADYEQIELRILAHFSQDAGLINAFSAGVDIHSNTAKEIFGLPAGGMDSRHRTIAKSVSFGIIYGQEPRGLAKTLTINGVSTSEDEARVYMNSFFSRFPKVKAYMDFTKRFARRHGFVETIGLRRRRLPDVWSKVHWRQAKALRQAINARIQGSSADMIKLAMIEIDRRFRADGLESRMVLQIHDELVFDVPKAEVEIVKPIIVDAMTEAVELSVPIEVSTEIGENWLQAH